MAPPRDFGKLSYLASVSPRHGLSSDTYLPTFMLLPTNRSQWRCPTTTKVGEGHGAANLLVPLPDTAVLLYSRYLLPATRR